MYFYIKVDMSDFVVRGDAYIAHLLYNPMVAIFAYAAISSSHARLGNKDLVKSLLETLDFSTNALNCVVLQSQSYSS